MDLLTQKQFENCDDFASYIFDSVLDLGDLVTSEFNSMTNLDIPKGRSLEQYVKNNVTTGDNFVKFGTVRSFLYDIYELRKSPLFDKFETVRRAYSWISMDPYRAARVNINEHIAELNYDLSLIPVEDHEWYSEKYVKHYLDWISAKGRTASPMVTGPANFPVERNRKALNSEHNKYEVFQAWREKSKAGIKKRIEYNKPAEVKQDEKWQYIKSEILDKATVIVGIDQGSISGYSRPLFVANLYGKIETIARNGELEIVEKALALLDELNKKQKKQIVTSRHKIWNLREIAIDVKSAKDNPNENIFYDIEGGQIIVNFEEDRIQVKHEEKPAKEIIELLKKNSFNWSRFHGCWQRKITLNTKFAIKSMFGVSIK